MKLIHLVEQADHDHISSEMKNLYITKYTIRPDGRVDVDGDVDLQRRCTSIPVKFGTVTGDFHCNGASITSLHGAPLRVCKDFYCEHTKITSLVGGPTHVDGRYFCGGPTITSLVGAPEYVGGVFSCYPATNLRAILPILKIKGIQLIVCDAHEIIMRHYKPDGTGDIIALQDDLIEAGWAHIARMK